MNKFGEETKNEIILHSKHLFFQDEENDENP